MGSASVHWAEPALRAMSTANLYGLKPKRREDVNLGREAAQSRWARFNHYKC